MPATVAARLDLGGIDEALISVDRAWPRIWRGRRRLPTYRKSFAWRLLRDSRTLAQAKIIFGIALLLIVSPINWIPGSIPVLGQLEDLALLAFAVNRFIDAAPASLRAEHREARRHQ